MTRLLLLTLAACSPEPVEDTSSDSGPDPACAPSPMESWSASVDVEPGEVASVEVTENQEWRVVADGDCVKDLDGDTFCPLWDLSAYHVVKDGHIVTTGPHDDEGLITNTTDREWRVLLY